MAAGAEETQILEAHHSVVLVKVRESSDNSICLAIPVRKRPRRIYSCRTQSFPLFLLTSSVSPFP